MMVGCQLGGHGWHSCVILHTSMRADTCVCTCLSDCCLLSVCLSVCYMCVSVALLGVGCRVRGE